MIARNLIYLCALVPVNLAAGVMIVVLSVLWSAYRIEQEEKLTCP